MDNAATRYVGSFIIEVFSDFMRFAIQQNNLSPDEVAIICLVAAESTRELRKDAFAMRNFSTEEHVFPDEARPSVSVKFIHTSLGMSRETTRRKVAGLVERGLLKRSRHGVFFPAQQGEDDYTKEVRSFLLRKAEILKGYLDKMPC